MSSAIGERVAEIRSTMARAVEETQSQLLAGLAYRKLINIKDKVDLLNSLPRNAIATDLPDPQMERFRRKKLLKYLFQLGKLQKTFTKAGCSDENVAELHYQYGRVIGLLGLKE